MKLETSELLTRISKILTPSRSFTLVEVARRGENKLQLLRYNPEIYVNISTYMKRTNTFFNNSTSPFSIASNHSLYRRPYGIIKICTGILLALSLLSCGGGGGDGDFIGAALVTLQASPARIDTADRMLVRADVSEVNDNGIALKFKFPVGLSYVPSSSSLLSAEQSYDITPTVNVVENNFRYLVYFIDQALFDKNNKGTVEFFLEGITRVIDGKLEVDADVDNPLISNDSEFDQKNPGFAAEASVDVNVEG